MTKLQKTILFILFIFIFLALSNFLILYATGYKLDVRKLQWQKTGGIFTKLNTKNAEFFLNNHPIGKSSIVYNSFPPYYKFSKKRLLPGTYDLTIKKENYFPLKKIIKIMPGIATFLPHIYLINKDNVNKLISELIEKNQKALKQKRIDKSSVEFENYIYFINPKDNLLYKRLLNNDNIKQLSLEPIKSKKYQLFVLDKDKIYLISQELTNPGVYFLNNGIWEKIHNQSANELLLSPNKKKLAIINKNEIYIVWLEDDETSPYFKKNHKELIARLSVKIDKLYWFKTNWHLIYVINLKEYHFIEIDPTGERNDVNLGKVII